METKMHNKRSARKHLGLFLAVLMIFGSVLPVFASTTQEKLSNAKAEQQATRSQLSSVQNRIQELDSKKGRTEDYLAELTSQLEELSNRLEELKNQYQQKQQELEIVQQELAQARDKEERQYEAMKLRIQYMYEASCTGNLLSIFLSSDNLSDFVSRVEYFKTISEYDRSLTEEYHNTVMEVQEKELQVEEEKAAIEILQQENAEQQEAIQQIYAATYSELRSCLEELDAAEASQNALAAQIRAQEERINSLIRQVKEEELAAQRAAEEAARRAAAEAAAREAEKQQKQQNSSGSGSNSSGNASSGGNSSGNGGTSSGNNQSQPAKQSTPAPTVSVPVQTEPSSSNKTYLGKFKTTAYCNCAKCCGKWAGGHTASGTVPTPGRTVAMGGIGFGTKLEINGHVYTVEDRGTAYGHVDIFFASHSEALAYGLKYADVYQVN